MRDYKMIETEYVTGSASLQELSKKYDIPESSLRKYSAKNKWSEKRNNFGTSKAQKIVEKVKAKDVKKEVDRLKGLKESGQNLEIIIQHKLTSLMSEENVSTLDIKQLTSSLRELTGIIRNLYSIPTQAEEEAQRIAAERLKLEQAKSDSMSDSDNEIVVHMNGAERFIV